MTRIEEPSIGRDWKLTRVITLRAAELTRSVGGRTVDLSAIGGAVADTDPWVDEDGLLRHLGRWVAVPDPQVPLARVLVDSFQCTVPDEQLVEAFGGEAGACQAALRRLARRVTGCGLVLTRVRRRGYILDRADNVVSKHSELAR